MRITSSMYYKNVVGNNNSKLSKELFDVNKQIASGLKIQYAQDDIRTFTETMRLDNEITSLSQVIKSVNNGYNVANQTDSVINEFQTSMDRTKVLLIQASNDSQSDLSRDSIAEELKTIKKHLRNLANTSINGKYLFSGSATDTKPIDDNNIYRGNDASLNSFTGSGVSQRYNIPGSELFLGEETSTSREVTSNVPQYNLSSKYPDFSNVEITEDLITIKTTDTIRDLMGDLDDISGNSTSYFYLNGTKSDGTTFTDSIAMNDNNSVQELLDKIGGAYGNTPTVKIVNVSMNDFGEIVVEDKRAGSSKLEFHMIGAIDYNATTTTNAANIDDNIYATAGDIDNLKYGETNFDKIITKTSDAANQTLFIKKFVESPYEQTTTYSDIGFRTAESSMSRAVENGDTLSITMSGNPEYTQAFVTDAETTYQELKNQIEADGDFTVEINNNVLTFDLTAQGIENGITVTTDLANDDGSGTGAVTVNTINTGGVIVSDISAIIYDRVQFTKEGSTLSSTIPQIIRNTNEFATSSTKLSEVADISSGTVNSLNSESLILTGDNINGNGYNVKINFLTAGSTFAVDTNLDGTYDDTYNIYNVDGSQTAADDMTYQQLMDVMNIIVGASPLPASSPGSSAEYQTSVKESKSLSDTYLTYDGKIKFEDKNATTTKATISLFDENAGNFSSEASVMNFQANNALTIRDAKTDFFSTFDELIASVSNYERYPDSSTGDIRNVGIENAISMIDDLKNHTRRMNALVGAQANSLQNTMDRTSILEISTITLRSDIIDTDLAESSLRLTQLQLNYQAMLSTVSKVSQLSLVNYL